MAYMVKNNLNLKAGLVKKALVGMAFFMLFTQCIFLGRRAYDLPPAGFSTTVTTKIQHPNQYNKYDLFQFYHNKKTYDYPGESMYWAPIGEKFLLKYDTLHPERGYGYKSLEMWHPVFLSGEVTNYTVGTLVKIYIKNVSFDYVYTIAGQTYIRAQYLPLNDQIKNHPELIKGAEFLVEYLVADPQRAILYIDKPKRFSGKPASDDSMVVPLTPDIHVLRPTWNSTPVVLPDSALTKHQSGW